MKKEENENGQDFTFKESRRTKRNTPKPTWNIHFAEEKHEKLNTNYEW